MNKNDTSGWIKFEFDIEIYSKQAVKNACYDYSGNCFFSIEQTDSRIVVKLKAQKELLPGQIDLNKFVNHVLDHQVRIDTEKEFKTIREMIVAQAFQPCENINEVVTQIISYEK